jgi:hypothetical protein
LGGEEKRFRCEARGCGGWEEEEKEKLCFVERGSCGAFGVGGCEQRAILDGGMWGCGEWIGLFKVCVSIKKNRKHMLPNTLSLPLPSHTHSAETKIYTIPTPANLARPLPYTTPISYILASAAFLACRAKCLAARCGAALFSFGGLSAGYPTFQWPSVRVSTRGWGCLKELVVVVAVVVTRGVEAPVVAREVVGWAVEEADRGVEFDGADRMLDGADRMLEDAEAMLES